LTVRLPPELKEQLGALAKRTRRTKSFLAGEAIASYVAREITIIEGIEQGLKDMQAGRVVSHEDAKRRVDEVIRSAKSRP
jgi:predicted transcriptional regulator